MRQEKDYVLGTHDDEISRLGLQHRVWRPRASDAWRRAGFTAGQTLLDIGCGPGWASLDLAEIVGPKGKVVSVDRSRRFLDALEEAARSRGLTQISTHEVDLNDGALPSVAADGAWVRWVFAFVTRPRDLLARIASAIRPGGVLVVHEYFDYRTWRFSPRSPALENLVRVVMESWRAEGGEPDIGFDLPPWLGELGFTTRSLLPIVEAFRPSDYGWQWPKTFVEVGLRRLIELGRLTEAQADEVTREFAERERVPDAFMITPAVLEIVAVKR